VFPKEIYEDVTRSLSKRISEIEVGTSVQFEEWDANKKAKEIEKLKAQIAKVRIFFFFFFFFFFFAKDFFLQLEEDAPVQMAHVTAVRQHFKQQADLCSRTSTKPVNGTKLL